MSPEDEYRLGREYSNALAKSRRHTKWTFIAAQVKGWTHEETMHYIDTGVQPPGKEMDG